MKPTYKVQVRDKPKNIWDLIAYGPDGSTAHGTVYSVDEIDRCARSIIEALVDLEPFEFNIDYEILGKQPSLYKYGNKIWIWQHLPGWYRFFRAKATIENWFFHFKRNSTFFFSRYLMKEVKSTSWEDFLEWCDRKEARLARRRRIFKCILSLGVIRK